MFQWFMLWKHFIFFQIYMPIQKYIALEDWKI